MSNIDTVKQMYEAFGRGDVPAILDKLDDNVEWDTDYTSPAAPSAGAAPWQSEHPGLLRSARTAPVHQVRPPHDRRNGQQGDRSDRHRGGSQGQALHHPQ